MTINGQIVDLDRREIYPGEITWEDGRIRQVKRLEQAGPNYIMPGFIDAHVHIESSMLVPSEFARLAVLHGTVATVSDPHEIANVLGMEGVEYMLDNAAKVPFKFFFGAPSCVPATPFETAGARLGPEEVEVLLQRPEIKYLSEVMNYPGVLGGDEEVMAKLEAARRAGKPIDGHAPGLRGEKARKYVAAGISTDHECSTREEALEKLGYGMKIIIREGSAARNFDALVGLIADHTDALMFCSDDKHPDDLVEGHINALVARAVAGGQDLFDVLRVACLNPVKHYGLEVGLLKVGDPADFIVVEDLESFEVRFTYIDGQRVATFQETLIARSEAAILNRFEARPIRPGSLACPAKGTKIKVIEASDGLLTTGCGIEPARIEEGLAVADVERDLLKIVVQNRYAEAPPAVGFVRGFGLRSGAIAGSVAHDSHNIVAVGVDDDALCRAINLVIEQQGGIAAVEGPRQEVLALPVGGIMCNRDGFALANTYSDLDGFVKRSLGTSLRAPFMTLSFMALLVIPALKLSDRGLFDGEAFQFADLFEKT